MRAAHGRRARRAGAWFPAALLAAAILTNLAPRAAFARARGKIFILMVWDGMRPDLAEPRDTPNLAAAERAGVRLARHHAVYPTLTMVNAAALATGGLPASDGIFGDSMYLAPALDMARAQTIESIGYLLGAPLQLEHTQYLAALNDPRAFAGRVVGLETVAAAVERAGGYVGVIGKGGPTLLFDPRMGQPAPNERPNAARFLFVADDFAAPAAIASKLDPMPPMTPGNPASIETRDAWFAHIVIGRALPAARAASVAGRPALIVFWQHNPDLAQHIAGLGTRADLDAMGADDRNLAAIRKAVAALGIADHTDLMVVSDHGFATIKAEVPLGRLLKSAVLKDDANGAGVVVARNGGSDLVYLPPGLNAAARAALMRKIVNYAIARPWCGPIFARDPDAPRDRRGGYAGAIDGTFSEAAFGLGGSRRAPDLVISFREFPDESNRGLTGPSNPAVAIGPHGDRRRANHSAPLVRPVAGVIYSDAPHFTTGMGMHGALGARELHNVGAAIGPDFRRGYIDELPTSNSDVAPTIERILGIRAAPGASGRVIAEALAGATVSAAKPRRIDATVADTAGGARVTMTIHLLGYAGRDYPDGVSIERVGAR